MSKWQRATKPSPMLAHPEPAEGVPDAIVQPLVDGIRVLVCWHGPRICFFNVAGKTVAAGHITRYLRGPRGTAKEGPLQYNAVLDGALFIPGKTAVETQRAIKNYARNVQLMVYDCIRPGGWEQRMGHGPQYGDQIMPGPAQVVADSKLVHIAYPSSPKHPGPAWVRPPDAPYVAGENHVSLFLRKP